MKYILLYKNWAVGVSKDLSCWTFIKCRLINDIPIDQMVESMSNVCVELQLSHSIVKHNCSAEVLDSAQNNIEYFKNIN